MNQALSLVLLLAIGTAGTAGAASPTAGVDPLQRPALQAAHAQQAVLLGSALAGHRWVVVGERGIVLWSDDEGKRWQQGQTPVSVTLTAVQFVTPAKGWAVGHSGVVLHTEDGGLNWTLQLDGARAAALVVNAARAALTGAPDPDRAKRSLADAERLQADGPDKPFLDLYFQDERVGFVVGAYNLIFRTEDGGANWLPCVDRLDNPKAAHLYAIRGGNDGGKTIYVAGEQGVFFRSDDGGESFGKLPTPYAGSFFALSVSPSGGVTVAGLRGNAFHSETRGASWSKVGNLPMISIVAAGIEPARSTADGEPTAWLANEAGQLFASTDDGRTFAVLPAPPGSARLPPVTGFLATSPRGGLVTTLHGVMTIPLVPPPPGR